MCQSYQDGTRTKQVQKEADAQSGKLREAIDKSNRNVAKMWGVIEKLRETIEEQSVTIRTVQEVHTDLKNGNGDLVVECKAAADEVAERIQSGDIH